MDADFPVWTTDPFIQQGFAAEDLGIQAQTKEISNTVLERELRENLQQKQKLQTREALDQTRTSLNTDRQQREKLQDQLLHTSKEVACLQQELTGVRHTTEKKIQRMEIKIRVLLKKLTESKKQHSDCQRELLGRETTLEKLNREKDDLRAKVEDQNRECVHLDRTKEQLEADLALSREKLHTSHLEVHLNLCLCE